MTRHWMYKKIKERGKARLKICGNVHKCMRKLRNGPLRANQLRRSMYTMCEVEKALVLDLIKREDHVYSLTEQGREWLKAMDLGAELGEKTIIRPVEVSERWLEYFRRHVW